MGDADHAELASQLVRRWNAGDFEGVLDLFHADGSIRTGPDWPEQTSWTGREGMRAGMDDWTSVWESARIEDSTVEPHGGCIVATGAWISRGRASGAGARMEFVLLLRFRDGKIESLEWFADHDSAVAAAAES